MSDTTHHPAYTTTGPAPDFVTGYNAGALDDWRAAVARFEHDLGDRRVRPPRDAFRGVNFVTNEVLGYVTTPRGIAEVSTGMMRPLLDHRVFGVTFAEKGPDGAGGASDPSCFCAEWGDVLDACNAS